MGVFPRCMHRTARARPRGPVRLRRSARGDRRCPRAAARPDRARRSSSICTDSSFLPPCRAVSIEIDQFSCANTRDSTARAIAAWYGRSRGTCARAARRLARARSSRCHPRNEVGDARRDHGEEQCVYPRAYLLPLALNRIEARRVVAVLRRHSGGRRRRSATACDEVADGVRVWVGSSVVAHDAPPSVPPASRAAAEHHAPREVERGRAAACGDRGGLGASDPVPGGCSRFPPLAACQSGGDGE